METQPIILPEYSGKPKFQQTALTENHWLTTARWAMFFAIYGFLTAGINVLLLFYFLYTIINVLVVSPYLSAMISTPVMFAIGFMMTLIAVSIVFLSLGSRHHLQFSRKIPHALRLRDQDLLTEAWKNMKGAWKMFGIYTLVMLVCNLFVLVLLDHTVRSNPYL